MKGIKVVLFGSLLIFFFIEILMSQPLNKPMIPEGAPKLPSPEKI